MLSSLFSTPHHMREEFAKELTFRRRSRREILLDPKDVFVVVAAFAEGAWSTRLLISDRSLTYPHLITLF